MKLLRYIELKTGHSDNGPAWIAYVAPSKSGRTLYFNGRGLMKLKGQRRGDSGGNYIDITIDADALDTTRCQITDSIVQTDIVPLSAGKCLPETSAG